MTKYALKIGTAVLAAVVFLMLLLIVFLPGPPKLIPRALLFGNPERAQPTLSPNGQQLAYLAPNADNVLNVWIQPLHSSQPPIQITSDKKRGIRQFLWQYDNQHLLYLQDSDGDENWHLYQTHLETHVTRDLTPFQGIRADLVAYEPSQPAVLLVQMNLRDRSHFDVYRLDLITGAVLLDTQDPDSALALVPDHHLVVRAAQSYTEDGGTLIRVRDDADAPWRELVQWGPQEALGHIVGFSPDNQSLHLFASIGSDTARLMEINLASSEKVVLAEDPRYDLGSVLTDPHTHALQAVGVERDRFGWILLDPKLQPDFQILEKLGPSFQIQSRTLDDSLWIVTVSQDIQPPHYYLYDRRARKATLLFSSRPSLEGYPLSAMQPISFQAQDGMQLYGYLTLPRGYRPHRLPTVLLVHGGPWSRDQWGYSPIVQWLSNRGYAVLQVNYRGSRGYGKAYLNAGNREWGRLMQQDLIDAKGWLIAQGYADPEKVAIFGGSYGGYAALAGLAFTPQEFCCGVDIVGISNLETFLQTQPPYWKPAQAHLDQRIGNLEKDHQLLVERSPLHRANEIERPLLIGHGARDPRVNQAESDQIVSAMRANQQTVEYLLFPDEGHGFARPENRLKFYAASEHFLTQQLGGREEPPAPHENWNDVRK